MSNSINIQIHQIKEKTLIQKNNKEKVEKILLNKKIPTGITGALNSC
jgi:hypothetical protein